MKNDFVVKAYEEEIGTELYIVTSDKPKEETMEILKMAARYSTVDAELEIDEGIAEYDEFYKEIVDNQDCGLHKFVQYVELRGLKIKPITYDFEFEW